MKILIRGTNWIGDSIMSIPAMREVRRIFPDAQIALHTRASSEGLFSNASFIDEIIAYKRNRWPIMDVYDNTAFLSDERFDLAILFPNSFQSALIPFLSRVPVRIGYNKDLRGLLLTHPIAVPEWKNRRHEVFYYLNLVSEAERRILGRDTVSRAMPDISLDVSEDRKHWARQKLASVGVDNGRKTVLLGVGSTNSKAKRWPAERFAALCDLLQIELAANVVLIGSPGDKGAAAMVSEMAVRKPVDLVGSTTVAEAAAITSVADLLISNDMGLAHVAPAVGTRTIVIFGPTDPETTRPFSDKAAIVRHDVPCSPCMLRECPIDHRCMIGINAKTILEAADRLLAPDVIYETTGSIS
jgi:heptosyltransferase II